MKAKWIIAALAGAATATTAAEAQRGLGWFHGWRVIGSKVVNGARDSDTIYPTFKAMCDGIVDAGIVPDDTPEYMTKLAPIIRHEPGGTARLELEVTS